MKTLDDLLSAAGHVQDISPHQQQRAFVPVCATLRTRPDVAPVTGRRRLGGANRRLVLTGVAAAVAAAITIPVVSVGNGQSAAAATLLRAAGNAAGAQQGGWPNAAYWHVASVYVRDGHTYHRDIWVSHHGQSVLRDDGVGSGVMPLGPGIFPAGGISLTWDQLYALPTDPGQLEAALNTDIKGAGPNPIAELFTIAGDLLRESPAPPALRKALYDVAAGIPGVQLVGRISDAAGRTGTGVERDGETLVIDPGTGELLADTETGWSSAFVSQGPTSTAPPATTR
jgi:hypothetical protein